MKTKFTQKNLGLVAALSILAACGNNNDEHYGLMSDPYFRQLAAKCGEEIPQGTPVLQTTTAYEEHSGTQMNLVIYGDGQGRIGAIGTISIPRPDLVFANANYYQGSYSNFQNQAIGATCISSRGMTGQLEGGYSGDQINITLTGNGITVSAAGNTTLDNQTLAGMFNITLNNGVNGLVYY